MARSMCFLVSEDQMLIQKYKEWGNQNGVQVRCFTPQQWNESLENPGYRSQVMMDGVAILPGSQSSLEGGKVLPFPTPTQMKGDGKRVATMDELESEAIRQAISEYRGNLTEAAKALGIGRATLYRKVKQYNIDPSEARNRGPKAA